MAFVIFAGQSNALGFGMSKATLAKAGFSVKYNFRIVHI